MSDGYLVDFAGHYVPVEYPESQPLKGASSIRHGMCGEKILIAIRHSDGTTLVAALTADELHDFAHGIAERLEEMDRYQACSSASTGRRLQ